jgi:hypothetical protein
MKAHRAILVCVLVFFSAVAALADTAQFTLENRINQQLNLFVDGQYASGPVMTNGGICTTQVTPDVGQVFEARTGMDPSTSVMTRTGTVPSGGSPTMTVCFIDPQTGRCPGD